ncbi:hypothetical protein [Paraburkholderia sp. CI3]|uniref:hypothetical protein n=1 Tax=Paraburkholderia sp. CI3 TaxID=2991060 RepID=UPI003D211AB1
MTIRTCGSSSYENHTEQSHADGEEIGRSGGRASQENFPKTSCAAPVTRRHSIATEKIDPILSGLTARRRNSAPPQFSGAHTSSSGQAALSSLRVSPAQLAGNGAIQIPESHVIEPHSKNSTIEKATAILLETLVHGVVGGVAWGNVSNAVNYSYGPVDSTSFSDVWKSQAYNVAVMSIVSYVIVNTLFSVVRGSLGYKIEKAIPDASASPTGNSGLASTQREAEFPSYASISTDALCGTIYGGVLAGASNIPFPDEIAGAMPVALAAASVAFARTCLKLSRHTEGKPAYQVTWTAHHNPFTKLADEFRKISERRRADEPPGISNAYRGIRNHLLKIMEDASVWGLMTVSGVPAGVLSAMAGKQADNTAVQFVSGYLNVALGYFFDQSLNRDRSNEEFAPWEFKGSLQATRDLAAPVETLSRLVRDIRSGRVSESDRSALATTRKFLEDALPELWRATKEFHGAKGVLTTYPARWILDLLTSVEHSQLHANGETLNEMV